MKGYEDNWWRVGRKIGRTIYAIIGEEVSDKDPVIGMMDTTELAKDVVRSHNILVAQEGRFKKS